MTDQEVQDQVDDDFSNLTPEKYIAMRDEMANMEAALQSKGGEPLGVVFGVIEGKSGGRVSVTAKSYQGAVEALDLFANMLIYAKNAYGMTLIGRPITENVPANSPAAPVSAPIPAPSVTQPPIPPSAPKAPEPPKTPAPSGEKGKFVLPNPCPINKIEVSPTGDGIATIKFFAPTSKYAVFQMVNRPIDELIEFMSQVVTLLPDHFRIATSYSVNGKAHWVNSEKLNAHNEPFKNIKSIVP